MKQLYLIAFLFVLISHSSAKEAIIFFDDFNTTESYQDTLTLNATSKEYVDNSLQKGHLLKKWNYGWDYDYFKGDWKQAFWCVAPGDSVMIQAGRSACHGGYLGGYTFRITAKAEIPRDAQHYKITLKRYKSDNDPHMYCIGCDENGKNGIEFGFENQLPGTDQTVNDAYLLGQFGDGVFRQDMGFHRQWVDVEIDVDIANKFITWRVNGIIMSSGHVADLKPGGYFGMYQCYDRNSKFDDVTIAIIEKENE